MPDVILHQYAVSPYSEKVRVCLGIKGLAWASVEQPVIMPKPDLVALTGGYRRIPVMQIGADVYCDSQRIVDELERRFPAPTLFPAGDPGLALALGLWTDRALFQAAVAVIFGAVGEKTPAAFIKDREAMSGRPFDVAAMKAAAPKMAEQLRAQLALIERQLADGRRFLTGEAPGLADAQAYYNVWWLRAAHPDPAPLTEGLGALAAWADRVRALGHGRSSPMSPADAVAAAAAAEPEPAEAAVEGPIPTGAEVEVRADDYGRDPIRGRLARLTSEHIAIRRTDPRAGEVCVHFPRIGYAVRAA